jgi:hypothetical protein
MFIYEVTGSAPPIRFCAGKFSNGVWGFFVPAQHEQDSTSRSPQKTSSITRRRFVNDQLDLGTPSARDKGTGQRNGHLLRLGTENAVHPARVTALREGAA